ncbi:GNAT family N-acetyltransferase [Vibrio sp. CDRSL-10 TSBA]
MEIKIDDLQGAGIIGLLEEHLADMHATSPAESVHALDVEALQHPSITFWSAAEGDSVLGCVALKSLSPEHGEIKSMRTAGAARNKGVATKLLHHLITEAKSRGFKQLSLETGTQEYFSAAHCLYAKYGFVDCEPFGDYQPDPNSKFMTLVLAQ